MAMKKKQSEHGLAARCGKIEFCRGNGKSTLTLLAIAKKAGCLEEVLRELKNRAGGDGDEN